MSTFFTEPILSLTMPQKATEAMPTAEAMALSTPSSEAVKPTSCR